ncbi:MAG: hypothetical protein EHM45_06235 [Desulfobacteraceae bacterium]|nr:MAG: hypothetical protein EHM45_06235 [Desulfobacteraceae bacterium]
MSILKTIHLHCRSQNVKDRLQLLLEQIIASHQLPFKFEVLTSFDPNRKMDLIIFETNAEWVASNGLRELEEILECSKSNIVLVCSPKFDYLELAKRYGIGNVILSDHLNPNSLRAILARLLGDEFFGFKPFFTKGYNLFYQEFIFCGRYPLASFPKEYFQEFAGSLSEEEKYYFYTNINELLINAFSFGVYGIQAEERDRNQATVPDEIFISKEKEIKVLIARDHEKYGISIMDRSGSLTLERVLEKIHRHTPLEEKTIPKGITDLSGRGLFMISRQSRLIVNILKSVRTEVIILRYNDPTLNAYQSLIINEKNSAD